ncbi:MAG: glycosyl transferase, partial [Actinomycetes bacterium]
MNTTEYCTYFDLAYAPRGRVLIESLRQQGDHGLVHVLALDAETFDEVTSWSGLHVRPLRLSDLELAFPQLASAQQDRSRMEYVFTLTPWLTLWVMNQVAEGSLVTYLDADMAFFSSTSHIYEELADASVGIVEHRFTWEQSWRRKYGTYNVAWVTFRRDKSGKACLQWWADQCLEWCRDEVTVGRFADQGYLDSFPELFDRIVVIKHPGADLAPWNLRRHEVTWDGQQVDVDGRPLVFFHFHGLRSEGQRFRFKHVPYLAKTTQAVRE